MKVTIDQIAQSSGVSASTVSRVLAGSKNVSKRTRDAVVSKMLELNYETDKVSQFVSSNANRNILILLEDITRASSIETYRAANKYLEERGYTLLISECSMENRSERIRAAKHSFKGCIIISGALGNRDLNEFANSAFPLVAVHWCNEWSNLDSIIENVYSCAYLSVEHLASMGHKHVALINSPKGATGSSEALQGYEGAAAACGLHMDRKYIIDSDLSFASGVKAADYILHELPEVTGVICANRDMGSAIIHKFSASGKRVPEDYSVVAFGLRSDALPKRSEQRLSAVGSDAQEKGKMAAKCLLDKIQARSEGKEAVTYTQKIILETRLMEGDTVAPPRSGR